jgi:lysophospholipase L1-like esterase
MRRLIPLLFMALVFGPAPAVAGTLGTYVALGDSYTSGPLIPNQHGDPIDCGRSDHNYPSLVAAALKPRVFTDVSCGSAQTKDMTSPQTGLPLGGTNPPQFNALGPDVDLVTVGIGGNDAGLVGVAEDCASLDATSPNGTPCKDKYTAGGRDQVAEKIEQARPKIDAVLRGIHARSPHARVAIAGYPHVTPPNGQACWPTVPLSPGDMHYVDQLIIRINQMIEDEALRNDAEFIDTYRDSGGHDVCKLPPNRWFEGLVPTEPAYPLHPNGKGEASMARSTIAQLKKPRPAGTGSPAGSSRCLARRPAIGGRGIGRIRLGQTRRALGRLAVTPVRRTRAAYAFCTKRNSGRVSAVFSKRGRVELILSTAPSAAFGRAYPTRRRIASGLFRASPRSSRLLGVRGGRVRFVAVVSSGVLQSPRRLVRDLRVATR